MAEPMISIDRYLGTASAAARRAVEAFLASGQRPPVKVMKDSIRTKTAGRMARLAARLSR